MRVEKVSLKKKILVFLLVYPYFLCSETQVFFSPQDKISKKLIHNINESKRKIHAAVYMLTDKKIATALINAKNERGIDVQIITDQTCLEYKYGKIELLKEKGIDVFIFKNNFKNKKRPDCIMHNKFALLDNKVWTGSFNWTKQANKKNQENVICTDEIDVYKKYNQEFKSLKKRCVRQAMDLITQKRKTKSKIFVEKSKEFKGKLVGFLKGVRDKLKGNKKKS